MSMAVEDIVRELEGGGNWSNPEALSLNHTRRFVSAALTKRLRFAVTYPNKITARIHGPQESADALLSLIEETRTRATEQDGAPALEG